MANAQGLPSTQLSLALSCPLPADPASVGDVEAGAGPDAVQHRTAWHPIAGDVLGYVLPAPRGYQVLLEYQLNLQPLRTDYLIIVKDPLAQPLSSVMGPLTRYLGPYNVVELTGPTSQLTADDFRYLDVYSTLASVRLKLQDHREVYSFVLASRLTRSFCEEARRHRGRFVEVEAGVHMIEELDHKTYVIETEAAGDNVMKLFSPLYLANPAGLFALLNEEEKTIFWMIYGRIEQFRKDPRTELKYPDWKDIRMTTQEFMDNALSLMSPEELLRRVSPEDRLRGLSTEERLRGLPAEEMYMSLSPEAREQLKKLF